MLISSFQGGFTSILCILFLKETHAPTLLRRRAVLKNKQERSDRYVSVLASKLPPSELLKNGLVRPLKMLFTSPVIFLLSAHLALAFGYVVRDLFVAVYSNPDILTNETP